MFSFLYFRNYYSVNSNTSGNWIRAFGWITASVWTIYQYSTRNRSSLNEFDDVADKGNNDNNAENVYNDNNENFLTDDNERYLDNGLDYGDHDNNDENNKNDNYDNYDKYDENAFNDNGDSVINN